ncbi:mirror-image polydactyly gene 1 protein [Acanthochromis polyacanthus]|uniref:mirror-image polydactyly gene 1 protein n=1 Tax=Acanthochromis polyacanthus TaxID=80966 RepID=UPI00223440D1|nr:mirror-image polydactyly gene 1 protein [Acanthochromis polyacanthus]
MASSRALDVQFALQRAKKKICDLQQQLKETSSEGPEETSLSIWTPSKELRDSLVDMYRANPKVNVELRQRLPSPERHHLSSPDRPGSSLNPEITDWPQAPQYLQELPTSCSISPLSHRRSVSPVFQRRSVSPVFQRRSVSPVFQRSSVSPVSPVFQRSSVSPVSPPSYRRSVSPLSSRLPTVPGDMEVDLSHSRGPSPRVESSGDAPDDGATSRGPGSPALRRHLVPPADSPHQLSAASRLQSFDRDKNVSFLLKELDAMREINNKLQDQLVQKEKELQRREVEEELREEQREAQHWGRPAAVLEEVLAAQKDRDQALMSRLLLANEERDEALLRARRLQQAAESDSFNLEDTDLDIDELIQQVHDADSGQDVHQFGSVLVERLRLARQRRNDITAQEMKAVMEERDRSVIKCKRLEQDLLQENASSNQDELLRLERERDRAVEDRRRLEAEIQALRANHSSQDLALPSQPSSPGDGAPPPPQVEPQQAPPPQALLVQLQRMSQEKQSVEAELQRCQEAEREASERVRRLERLVEVLRKKVGAGSLRSVI